MSAYPACVALGSSGLSAEEIATKLRQVGRVSTKKHGSINEAYIQKLIKGEAYAPDSLRVAIAKILGTTENKAFPEYCPACATLKRFRLGRELSQEKLASRIKGRTLRACDISNYECGSKRASEKVRRLMARFFKVNESTLFPEYQIESN